MIGSVHPVERLLEAHPEPYLRSVAVQALVHSGHRDWAVELCELPGIDLRRWLDVRNRVYWAAREEEGEGKEPGIAG